MLCNNNKLVVIGRDTRESGKWLDEAIIEGLMAQGAKVVDAGVIPTPGVSYLTRHLGKILNVIVEKKDATNGFYRAISDNYIRPLVRADNLTEGSSLQVKAVSFCGGELISIPE